MVGAATHPLPLGRALWRRAGGAGAAGRIEHKVAGVGGHEEAALNDLRVCLDDIDLI